MYIHIQLELYNFMFAAESTSESLYSDITSDSYHPRFEFRNAIAPRSESRKGSLSRDQLQSMLKHMLFEPEGIHTTECTPAYCCTLHK